MERALPPSLNFPNDVYNCMHPPSRCRGAALLSAAAAQQSLRLPPLGQGSSFGPPSMHADLLMQGRIQGCCNRATLQQWHPCCHRRTRRRRSAPWWCRSRPRQSLIISVCSVMKRSCARWVLPCSCWLSAAPQACRAACGLSSRCWMGGRCCSAASSSGAPSPCFFPVVPAAHCQ